MVADLRYWGLPFFALLAGSGQSGESQAIAEDFWYKGVVSYAQALEQARKNEWLEAMELYQTAASRMAFVAEEYPHFQPEIVGYRLEALRQDAAQSYSEVCALDHHAADAYFALMDRLATGEREASLHQWEASVRTLLQAHLDLMDLRIGKPEFFPLTIRRQMQRCEAQLQQSESRLRASPGGKALLARLQKELGELEIAGLGLPKNPEIVMSPALFP